MNHTNLIKYLLANGFTEEPPDHDHPGHTTLNCVPDPEDPDTVDRVCIPTDPSRVNYMRKLEIAAARAACYTSVTVDEIAKLASKHR